jgi:hypothetical protein
MFLPRTFSTTVGAGLLLAALGLSGRVAAQVTTPPAQLWDKTIGGNAEDRLNILRATPDGGFILGGQSNSGVSGSKSQPSVGGADYWIVKVDSAGVKQWDKTFGGGSDDRLYRLELTPDGGYILAGESSSGVSGSKSQGNQGGTDYWIIKVDSMGVKQWDKTFGGGSDDKLTGLQLTSDGGYVVGGQTISGVSGDRTDPGQGGFDYWIVKVDSAGTMQWDRSVGGIDNDLCNALVATPDGGYVIGGFSYSGIGGDKTEDNKGGYDYWIIQLDSAGVKVWDRTLGGAAFDNLTSLIQTADGGYLAGGFSNSGVSGDKTTPARGDFDNWIVKLSPTGVKQWDKTYGGDGYDSMNSMIQTTDGGYLFGSQSNSGLNGDKTQPNYGPANTPDYWVVKTDSLGAKQWDGTYGGAQDEVLTSLVQAGDSSFVLGGFSSSGISGAKTTPNVTGFDYWIVRLGAAEPTGLLADHHPTPLALYPNPAHGTVRVQLPTSAPRSELRASLFDATGRLVWQQPLGARPADDRSLPLTFGLQPAGLYLLQVDGPDGYRQANRLRLE